jgi:hypothetical protein
MRYQMKLFASVFSLLLFASFTGATIPAGYTGTPFSFDTLKGHPQQIPGCIKSVFFDNGGEGVAYHDNSTGNTGGTMRLNASNQQIAADINVDMQSYSGNDWDVVGYGTSGQHDSSVNAKVTTWHLSWIDASGPTTVGDWLKFTVHVNQAGIYYVSWKQATANANGLQTLTFYNGDKVKIDSIRNIPVCTVPPGCPEVWHAWTVNKNVDSVQLDTGLQVIKLAFITGSWNFDWMMFTLKSGVGVRHAESFQAMDRALRLTAGMNGGRVTVSYDATAPKGAKITLTDCSGRTILSTVDNCVSAGKRSVTLGAKNLGQGVYFVTIEHNGMRSAKSISITR